MGLELFEHRVSKLNLQTITECTVCLINLDKLDESALNWLVSKQAVLRYLEQISLPHETKVEKKLAAFFLKIIKRFSGKTPINLPFSYIDLSKRLGTANETISRILHQFQEQKIIEIDHKQIINYDLESLEAIADITYLIENKRSVVA